MRSYRWRRHVRRGACSLRLGANSRFEVLLDRRIRAEPLVLRKLACIRRPEVPEEIHRHRIHLLRARGITTLLHESADEEIPEDEPAVHPADLLELRFRDRTAIRDDCQRFELWTCEIAPRLILHVRF